MAEPCPEIADLPELLAHALELEHAAAARYRQLADSLLVHHNYQVADLFRQLAARTEERAALIARRAHGVKLPAIAPWDFQWDDPDSPKTGSMLDLAIGYQMNLQQALRFALKQEIQGHAFYTRIATCVDATEVRILAADLSAAQREHISWVKDRLEQIGPRVEKPLDDLDPPNVPE